MRGNPAGALRDFRHHGVEIPQAWLGNPLRPAEMFLILELLAVFHLASFLLDFGEHLWFVYLWFRSC